MTTEPEQKNPLQITPQLMLMVLLVFLMLALPLTVAAYFLVVHFRESRANQEAPAAAVVIDDSALRGSFEAVAASAWGDLSAPLDADNSARVTIRIVVADLLAEQMKMISEVAELGGTTLVFPSEDSGNRRLLATLPAAKASVFLAARDQGMSIPADQDPVLIEVIIVSKVRE